MTVVQALLLGLASWLVGASPLNGGQFNQVAGKPLVSAFLCGLIMGNMKAAMAIGVPLQAMYLGVMAIGGVATMPSAGLSIFFIIPLCILTGADVDYALTLAVPFAIVEQFLRQLKDQVSLFSVHWMQNAIAKGNIKKGLYSIYTGWIWQALISFTVPVIGCLAGQDAMIALVSNMPAWLTGIMNVFSNLCPLIGFSLLLNSLVTNKGQLLYVILGFTLLKVLNLTTLEVTVVGLVIAYLYYILSERKSSDSVKEAA